MKVGFAKQDITPMIPVDMAGYMDRKEQAKGVLEPLYGRAIYIEDCKGNRVAFIFLDLLYITSKQANIIKEKIVRLLNIDTSHIVISASHTHSGPVTYENSLFGSVDKVYESWLLDIVPSIVLRASNSMEVCSIGWHQHMISEVGGNRRESENTKKTHITSIGFKDNNNRVIGGIINYNCHPTVLSKSNLLISADYPSVMIDHLESIYGNDTLFAFCNGAAGNISTRFKRRNQSYEEMVRLGRILGCEAIKSLESIEYEDDPIIKIIEKRFKLRPKDIPNDHEIQEGIRQCRDQLSNIEDRVAQSGEIKILKTKEQGYRIMKLLRGNSHTLEYGGVMTGISIGSCGIISQPSELFSDLGRYIIDKSRGKVTMIIGYSNGIIGYLPDEDEYKKGGYESLSCRFKCGEGENLANMAIDILNELF